MNPNLKLALDAVDRLFSDTSVSQEETLEALEEVQTAVETSIFAIKEDLAG